MALSKLAVRRLTKLADFMDSLPKEAAKHFNMKRWFSHEGTHDHRITGFITRKALGHCGTTACALGWACTIPAFKRAGLSIHVTEAAWSWVPLQKAQDVFEITSEQAHKLFYDMDTISDNHTPKQWAKYCRRFIRENAK